jgi:transposase-like protein
MDLFDFIDRFRGENDCLTYFSDIRKKAGVVCPKCGCNKHLWLAGINRFECQECKNQVSVKSGTVMENSKLPIKYWFMAIHLLTSDTGNLTMAEIQERLSATDQKEVHEMLKRLNECLTDPENGKSFDQLLLACIAHHNHPPANNNTG